MKLLTIAGASLALLLSPIPAMAQNNGATVVAGATCPSTNVLNVGNDRPLVETQQGALCVSGGGGGGSNASVSTTGTQSPASATLTGGTDGAGTLRATRTDAYGGMIGGTLLGTPSRTVLTASASTALPGGATTARPSYLRVTVETALTANLFLCLSNQTCSATVYDEMIPTGATAGTRLFEELPFTAAVTYFTTGTPTVNATRLAN